MSKFSHRSRLFVRSLEDRLTPNTYTVTSAMESGTGTLRDAITQANANPGADTINFDSSFNSAQTISLLNPLPIISDSVTLTGPGSGLLTVTRNVAASNFRIFKIENTSATLTVNMSGLKITNGNNVANGSGSQADQVDNGGGIYTTNEVVTLTDVVVSNCTSNAQGGGIAIGVAGQLTMVNCTVSGNTAQGLVNGDPLDTGFSGVGGGIYSTQDGILTMTGCTVSGNTAKYRGGGLYLFGDTSASATLRNCTIANNTTTSVYSGGLIPQISGGAGISAGVNPLNSGTINLTIQNCTVASNTSSGAGTKGGGILAPTTRTTLNMASTVVSSNAASTGPDMYDDKAQTANNCAISTTTGYTISGSNNLTGQNWLLGSLTNNGGPTLTMLPGSGSPLIDKGSNPFGLTTDQRGAGYIRAYNAADIGAVEVQPTGLPTAVASSPDITSAGATTFDVVVTYASPAGINVSTIDISDVTVTNAVGTKYNPTSFKVDVNTNGTPRVATYTISAPGGTWDAADAGVYTISMNANQVSNMASVAVPAGTIGTFKCLIPRTLLVTNKNDAGAGSLRQAILDANSLSPSQDIINFSSLFTLSSQTITLTTTNGPLIVTDSVKINGPGANMLTINTNAAASVSMRHMIIDGPGVLNVFISGMLFTGGHTTQNFQSERGGSMYINGENVTLDSVFMANNQAQSSYGGAIYLAGQGNLTLQNGTRIANNLSPNYGGGGIAALDPGHSITVLNSVVTDNSTKYFGGGIFSYAGGTVTIDNSTIANNITTFSDDQGGTVFGGGGGGIMMGDGVTGGKLNITNSTIEGNVSAGAGGGLAFAGATTGFLMRNCTIANNKGSTQTNGVSGGVLVGNLANTAVEFQNCTFTGNNAYSGGGLFVGNNDGASVFARSCIFAQNFSADPTMLPPDIDGALYCEYCLIGVQDGAGLDPSSHDNLLGSFTAPLDPMFGTYDLNGGTTNVMALKAGSPAIDTGSNPGMVMYDQRGPGFPRVSGAGPDIGAFEYKVVPPPSVATVQIDDGSAQRSVVRSITVTFSTLVNLGGGTPELAFQLQRTGPGSPMSTVGLSADLSGSTGTQTVAKLTFSGPLSESASLIDGRYTLTVLASQVVDNAMQPMAADSTTNLFRLFGDIDGNATVNTADFLAFRTAFGGTTTAFDFDNNGTVATADFLAFRSRFGASV